MKTRYENSLFYQISLSAKYFKILFEKFFKELNIGISAHEHMALAVIIETNNCCQRDLAKIILKDRANTGKLANALMRKGLITIEQKTKNNRMVKILTATKEGIALNIKIMDILKPILYKIQEQISKEAIEVANQTLKKFRNIAQKEVTTNI